MAVYEASVAGIKDGRLWLFLPLPEGYRESRAALVEIEDPRRITAQQRKKAYVLLAYIADWSGYTPLELVKSVTKYMFLGSGATLREESFSLADCSETEARLYIDWLIDFCITNDVPIGKDPLLELAEDIPRYVYACLKSRKCAVCGKKAELHHVDAVGMGRNRKEICHIGMRCLPLCRHHHCEIHSTGRDTFLKRYILQPVKIDREIAKVYRLTI